MYAPLLAFLQGVMVSRTEPHLVALQRGAVEIQCDYLDIVFVEHNLILVQTEGKSYQALVDVGSKKVEGKKLVETNNAANSILHMVLNQQSVEGISMDHRDLVSEKSEQTILPLIDSWINNGAKEK